MDGSRARRLCATALAAAAMLLGCCTRRDEPVAAQSSRATSGGDAPRASAVAGSFYPAEARELRATVQDLMTRARAAMKSPVVPADSPLVGIVVPHAGYVFSGLTAAHAFAALAGRHYDAVLLLGSPHKVAVRGASVYTGASFATPLGVVAVERELAGTIASLGPLFSDDAAPHAPEHSLEVELPFLQEALADLSIVPVLVMADGADLRSIAASMARALVSYRASGRSVLVVISTDLAHYPSRTDAQACDAEMLDALSTLDAERLLAANDSIMSRRIPNLACAMCGVDAAFVGLEVVRALGAVEGRLLDSSTSADAGVPGAGADEVVGYGSVAFLGGRGAGAPTAPASEAAPRFDPLTEAEQTYLLDLARGTIQEALARNRLLDVEVPAAFRAHLEQKRGVFVTLTLEGELRGCIGTHEPELPLWRTVQQMALASAFEDPRFPPLTRAELGRTRIEISAYLTGIEPLGTAAEYVVGRHGIIVQKDGRAATFLPHVAVEQGWDRVRTLRELCRKAGLPEDAWQAAGARFWVYETQVFAEAVGER